MGVHCALDIGEIANDTRYLCTTYRGGQCMENTETEQARRHEVMLMCCRQKAEHERSITNEAK